MSEEKPRNRYLQRRTRELQKQYDIKYTAALRVAKEEHQQIADLNTIIAQL